MLQLKFFARKKNSCPVSSLNTKWFPNLKQTKNEPTLFWWVGVDALSFENSYCQKKNKNQGYFFHTWYFSYARVNIKPCIYSHIREGSIFYWLFYINLGLEEWYGILLSGVIKEQCFFCETCEPSIWDYKSVRLEHSWFFTVILKKYHTGFLDVRCL